MLSKTKEDYLKGKGWSSHLFFEKAKRIFPALEENNVQIDYGRTVIYLTKNNIKIKAYVHHNGRNKEYLTFTNHKGTELKTFHYTEETNNIINFILEQFEK